MAANFYLSSHANYHLHPRAALVASRLEDLKHATEQELAWIEIWSASVIQKLCKRLGLRQQVAGTAIVYFRRFYLRNSYCDTDCPLVAAACCYVAAKAEETPVHVKSAVAEARQVFNDMGLSTFPTDNTKLAEMEFYLIEELDFHLIIFHPYRSLVQLCGRDGGPHAGGEAGRLSRAAMLEIDDTALQMAWFVINDTFRSSLCLIHPPHLIAIAAIYLAFSLHPPPLANITASSTNPSPAATAATGGPASRTRRQSVDTSASSPSTVAPLPPAPTSNPLHASLPARPSGLSSSTAPTAATSAAAAPPPRTGPIPPGGQTDPITFLSSLAIDHSLVLEIVQEVISLYELWNALESPSTATTTNKGRGGSANVPSGMGTGKTTTVGADERVVAILARMSVDRQKEIQREREQGKGTPSWKKG